jgi:hypothetical protein
LTRLDALEELDALERVDNGADGLNGRKENIILTIKK